MSEELPQPTPPVEKPAPALIAGYLVGLNDEGNFVFELVTKDQSLLELLGIHRYAESRVKMILDNRIHTGDKLTIELSKVVAALTQEVARLNAQLKQPDNKF